MSDKTAISWTDSTWNPIRGCSRVSTGCENCYAEKIAARFRGPGLPYEGLTTDRGKWIGQIKLVSEKLDEPLRWRKPRRIFVNSMSDLFHEGVPYEYILAVFGVMLSCPQHTFQILTKRPQRMRAWFQWLHDMKVPGISYRNYFGMEQLDDIEVRTFLHRADQFIERAFHVDYPQWPLPNVWLGVSVENQETADERIPLLLQTPAAVRFISAEPLLRPIDMECFGETGCPTGWLYDDTHLDWVIVGGESGPGAQLCNVEWIRSIVRQCGDANIPAFVKQLGAWPYLDVVDNESDSDVSRWFGGAVVNWDDNWESWFPRLRSRKGDDPSEWPESLRVQVFPS